MDQPTKIQVVFQGGGAKFAQLLAIAETLQDMEQSGQIEITRLAGTSAGSLVAGLLACGIDVKDLRGRLGAQNYAKTALEGIIKPLGETQHYNGAVTSKIKWLINILRRSILIVKKGKAFLIYRRFHRHESFGDISKLRKFLLELFQPESRTDSSGNWVGQGKPIFIVCTDLQQLKPRSYHHIPEDHSAIANMVDSIVHSCALPGYFRTVKDLADNPYVDGGIVNNFPASYLTEGDGKVLFGNVLGISFQSQAAKVFREQDEITHWNYLRNVVDAAMAYSVKTSTEHVDLKFDIPNPLETLDFDSAIKFIAYSKDDAPYPILKFQFENWLSGELKLNNESNSIPSVVPDSATRSGRSHADWKGVRHISLRILSLSEKVRSNVDMIKSSGCFAYGGDIGVLAEWKDEELRAEAHKMVRSAYSTEQVVMGSEDQKMLTGDDAKQLISTMNGKPQRVLEKAIVEIFKIIDRYEEARVMLCERNSAPGLHAYNKLQLEDDDKEKMMEDIICLHATIPSLHKNVTVMNRQLIDCLGDSL